MDFATVVPTLLIIAWLLPLAGFAVEIFAGYWQPDRRSKAAAYLAIAAIGTGFLCSATALGMWVAETDWEPGHSPHAGHADAQHAGSEHVAAETHGSDSGEEAEHADPAWPVKKPISGRMYTLGEFGSLTISLDYYIDSLTLAMFAMVTLIATCIHVFATGYMSEELTDEFVDHHAHTADGHHVHRPGRFHRFFAFMSLFCFSMLGLVLAGNIFMVFVFWELVGICSYLLIGFYVERKSASTAANKAFIMNRVGDFGFLIGLMVLWTYFGTFNFGSYGTDEQPRPGIFDMVRNDEGRLEVNGAGEVVLQGAPEGAPEKTIPYWLLVVAGLGIFAGCIGKSAQFPLQTWLPDAMEGPTPVSALVHSATMVAAGVYLAGRFYTVFTPDVLLVIAYVGCITLFIGATIAVVATDIKRVLAYSTISQLGYMMLGIGVGGWGAGLFHLFTHAFFKSLMFLCSGSVIAACHHEQEMTKMGGLRRKMPITAYTMLVGVIAISGLAIPGITAYASFSGYHSKDAVVATALAHTQWNPQHFLLFLVPLVTAGITAFYMFRMWFMTFAGPPRDHHVYEHAHETPWVMTAPLILLAFFAAFCAIDGEQGPLFTLLTNSEPTVASQADAGGVIPRLVIPGHELVLGVHATAGLYALLAAFTGFGIAVVIYGVRWINPAEIVRQTRTVHRFLVEKWQFDRLYDAMFVRPVHVVAAWATWVDRTIIDGILHGVARWTVNVATWDRRFDETVVDGLVNWVGNTTYTVGRSFRHVQTGHLRQYVMYIAVGVLMLFVLAFAFFPRA